MKQRILYSLKQTLFVCLLTTCTSTIGISQVYFSELSYNPCIAQGSDSDCEYVIITNGGTTSINISGWSISTAFSFTFPMGTSIPASGTISIGISSNCGGLTPFDVSGGWSGGLLNSGESIDLLDANGMLVTNITYSSSNGANGNCSALCFDQSGNVTECMSSLEGAPCMISSVAVTANSIDCIGNNLVYEVCGTAIGGSGNYSLVDTNNGNAVLATLTNQSDGTICFLVTIMGPVNAATIVLDILDTSDPNCNSGAPVNATIPNCSCSPAITLFPANGN